MRDTLIVLFGLLFLSLGVALFVDGTSTSDLSQTAKIIGGAAFLSLGWMCLSFALKNWLRWKRVYKESRNE